MPPDPALHRRSFHPWNSGIAEIPGEERWENRSTIHPKDKSPPEPWLYPWRGIIPGRRGWKMIDLATVKELRALRLPGMARELESQLEEPQRYKTLSFEDRLALLIDAESVSRRKNAIQRRIHDARLSESQACVEAIEYHEDRELDQRLITKLATCAYIRDNHHVVLKGATGAGKSGIVKKTAHPASRNHAAGAHCAKRARLTSGGRLSSFAVLRRRRL